MNDSGMLAVCVVIALAAVVAFFLVVMLYA